MVTKATTSKKKPAPTPTPAAKVDTSARVCVIDTHVGIPLLMRADPTEADVKRFVTEHQSRYHQGLPGGPDPQLPAFFIYSAKYYESEIGFESGEAPISEIDLTDALESARP